MSAPKSVSILRLYPNKSALIIVIIKLAGIPIATTKAIRKFTLNKSAKNTSMSPNRIFEETRFSLFLIQTEVSV